MELVIQELSLIKVPVNTESPDAVALAIKHLEVYYSNSPDIYPIGYLLTSKTLWR